MPYTEVPTTDGLYLVDYDLVGRIVHDSAFLIRKNDTAKWTSHKEGWGLPTTYSYEVDYKDARIYAEMRRMSFGGLGKIRSFFENKQTRTSSLPSGTKIDALKDELYSLEQDGRSARHLLKKKIEDASRSSMRNINGAVSKWETATEIAKFTRNASGDILLVGSAIVTGGASTVAIGGAGSLMKGAFKYQDTGNVGAGVMEASVSFVTVLIPGPKDGMSKGAARALLFTKAKTEFVGKTAVGLAEGKTLGEASLSSGLDVALGAAAGKLKGALIPEDQMKKLLSSGMKNVAIPVGLGLMDQSISTAQGKLNDFATKKLMQVARCAKGSTPKPGLPKVAISAPVLVDYAIIGPDRSVAPRSW